MRMDFNVLWVEDQPEQVEAQIERIKARMKGEGFELMPVLCTTLDHVATKLADNVFVDEVDLVLVDWQLGGDLRGENVISRIREEIHYKDVIFYSAETNVHTLKKAAHAAELEGVYFVSRAELVDEVVGVFESLIKKVLDLDHTRGIVMGATSDIDDMTRKCVRHAHDLLEKEDQESVLTEMLELIDEKLRSLSSSIEHVKRDASVSSLLDYRSILTANDHLRVLSRLLKKKQLEMYSGHREHVVAYMEKIVPQRNVLGHKVLSPEGKPTAIARTDDDSQFSPEDMKELRVQLLELRGRFRDLLKAMAG